MPPNRLDFFISCTAFQGEKNIPKARTVPNAGMILLRNMSHASDEQYESGIFIKLFFVFCVDMGLSLWKEVFGNRIDLKTNTTAKNTTTQNNTHSRSTQPNQVANLEAGV